MTLSLRSVKVFLMFLAALALAIAFDNLGRPLANPDEGRYSEISREMAATGDWVTPRLNAIKYFEKPPLQYWASALVFKLFGANEYTARLYVWLCALATLAVVGYTGWRLGTPETGMAAMLALVASPYFMALGGIVTLDMGLTLWTTVTVCAFLLAENAAGRPRDRRRWMIVAWAAIALAVLSKGLVGIVFAGAAVFFHILVHRDFSVLRRMEWVPGLLVFFALAAPWFVLVSRANPEFAHFFFVHEHFQRFLTTAHRRTEPWWYFLPIMAVGFLPWMFALPAAIRHAWRVGTPADRPLPGPPPTGTKRTPQDGQPMRVALLWSGFVVLFFSASGSKLPAYVLPAFPILALVLGRYLAEAPPRRLALWSALALPLAGLLLIAAYRAPGGAREAWTRAMYTAAQPWMYAAGAILIVALALSTVALRRGRRWLALVTIAIASVLMIDCLEDAYEEFSPRQSGYEVAQKMLPLLRPDTRVYSVKIYDQTVPFYIGRTVMLVDYGDEFETGLKSEPGAHIERIEDFPAEWLRPGDALAIMQPGNFEQLERQGLPMEVLHRDPRRILVRKP
jgi:4-amino-4-deoxy-L-arabinose transferase-like glycosyltransferase